MMNIDKSEQKRIKEYISFVKHGYDMSLPKSDFFEELLKKISNMYLEIEDKEYNYVPKKLNIEDQFAVVKNFYIELYGKDIEEEIEKYYSKMFFHCSNDFIRADGTLYRKINMKNSDIIGFVIDFFENILTSYLMVHEIGHAIYPMARKHMYNEVIAMTMQRIFGRLYDHNLTTFQSRQAIESVFFESERYDNIFLGILKNKVKKVEKFNSYKYLIGYIGSLYLSAYYQIDQDKFKNKILELRDDHGAYEKLLKYYGIKLESDFTLELVDVEFQKVLKRVSN